MKTLTPEQESRLLCIDSWEDEWMEGVWFLDGNYTPTDLQFLLQITELDPEQFREDFETRMFDLYQRERMRRLILSHDMPSDQQAHTREEVCWRYSHDGQYGVAQVRHAWYGYCLALGIPPEIH